MSKRSVGPRLRRTWPQRLLILFNVGAICAAVAGAGVIGYANKSVGEISRVRLGDTLAGGGNLPAGAPQNYLIVGADSDEGLAPGDPVRNDRAKLGPGVRSDTIMVLRIDPKQAKASILSFPRDLWVDIPGAASQRINAAINIGNGNNPNDPGAGQRLLVQTIKQNFQISINHYVQVNFAGFKSLVKLLGGVQMYFATPVRDRNSGLAIEQPGCATLDENMALNFARARHYQAFIDGRWKSDPQSDLTRIQRQQDFIRKLISKAIAQGARDPFKLKGLVDAGVANVKLDETLRPNDLIALGRRYRSFNPDTLQTDTLDVTGVVRHGAQVLDLVSTPHNLQVLSLFQGTGKDPGTTDGSLTPGLVQVTVLNGSGVQNQARDVTLALGAVGFQTNAPGPDPPSPGPQTVVKYPAGQVAQAQLVARYLAPAVKLEQSPDVLVVTVVTSTDFTRVLAEPKPASEVPVSSTSTSSTTTTTPTPGTAGPGGAPPTTANPFVPQTPPGVTCG
ncbi:MAG: transcriptional attenuator, LytR family [Acidimicrobiales bacterium]|nr:transcriptional attenuator, LytR family [Acidimicrobiales bacterium]